MRRSLLLICALGALAVPAAASAASLDAAGTTVVAFSDTHSSPFSSELPLELSSIRQQYCAGSGDQGPALSYSAGLAAAQKLVTGNSRPGAVAELASSPQGHTESRAISAAAGALGLNDQAAALAALLRAHQLAPGDPVPLIDAAPLLSDAGQGRAALALLTRAAREHAPQTDPFGISWAAVIDANRGEALLVAHQYQAAQAALKGALTAAPLLREAEQNLTVAYECAGNQAAAKRTYFLGVRRQEFFRGDYSGQTIEDPFGQLNEVEVLDTAHGASLTLPNLKYPTSIDEGVLQRPSWAALESDIVHQQEPALESKLQSEGAQLSRELASASPATITRTYDILTAVNSVSSEPDMLKLANQAGKLQTEFGQLQQQGEGQQGCVNGGLHSTWLATIQRYAVLQRNFASAMYRRQTALAANLADPLAHQLAVDQARYDALPNWFAVVDAGNVLAVYDGICDRNPPTGSEDPQSGSEDAPAGPACPSGLIGPDISLNLLVFSFTVTCEQAKVRATVGEGWVKGFVEGSHSFKNGSNTIFAGAQAGSKISTGPLSGGATARGGVYITFGASGAVQDVGLRAKSSASLTVGNLSGSLSGPELSISFVGAFAPLF